MATQDDWHNTNLQYESPRALLSVTHSAQRTGDQCLHGRARAQSSCTTESIQKSRAPDRNTSAGNCGAGGKLCFTNTVLRTMSDPQKDREAFARHHFGVDFAYWHLNSRLLSSIAHVVQLINLQTVPPLYSTERVVPTAAVEEILKGLQEPGWRTALWSPQRTPPCKHVAVHRLVVSLSFDILHWMVFGSIVFDTIGQQRTSHEISYRHANRWNEWPHTGIDARH